MDEHALLYLASEVGRWSWRSFMRHMVALAVIPVVNRPRVVAVAGNLQINVSGWDTDMGSLMDWYRDA